MLILDTPIIGLKLIEYQVHADERGHFARTFCAREFADHGLRATVAQANLAYNHRAGTVRGMHFQVPPAAETKLVRCTRGAILDIVVDLRPESATFLHHYAIELTPDNRRALYIPERFAHGYQTLTDGAEITYQVGEYYTPGYERGLRHDDPRLSLPWAGPAQIVSAKDRSWPLLDETTIALIRRELTP